MKWTNMPHDTKGRKKMAASPSHFSFRYIPHNRLPFLHLKGSLAELKAVLTHDTAFGMDSASGKKKNA